MSRTYQDVINDARFLLQDEVEPFRFDTSKLVQGLNRALEDFSRIRPDAFLPLYDRNNLNVPLLSVQDPLPAGSTSLSAEFPFERQFFTPLVAYVVGVTELQEDEFTVEGRAVALLQQFRASVLGA
jgi:hypothetical protein